jgi:hypothetical protein
MMNPSIRARTDWSIWCLGRTENVPPKIIKEEVEAREEGVPCAWSIELRWARRKKRRAVVAWRAGESGGGVE